LAKTQKPKNCEASIDEGEEGFVVGDADDQVSPRLGCDSLPGCWSGRSQVLITKVQRRTEEHDWLFRDGALLKQLNGRKFNIGQAIWKLRFLPLIVYRGSCENAGIVEGVIHRRFMYLKVGRNRLWQKVSSGASNGRERDTHEVYITFSLDAVHLLDAGEIMSTSA
jgi:hypothetical protein